MAEDLPGRDALRHALREQTVLLMSPPTPDALRVRLHRVFAAADDLLELAEDGSNGQVRDLVSRTLAWGVERVGVYRRLPSGYAEGWPAGGLQSSLLALVDELDLLGLTLDHAYDAAHRGDEEELSRRLSVVVDAFPSRTDVPHLITPEEPLVDPAAAQATGAEVGEDGIPRIPVPEQPDPHHLREDP